jgi:hypothetical protein
MLDNEISTVLTVEEKNSKIYRAGGLELPVERRLGLHVEGKLGLHAERGSFLFCPPDCSFIDSV